MDHLEVQPGCLSHFFSRKTRPRNPTSRSQTKSPLEDKSSRTVEKGSITTDELLPTDSKPLEKTVSKFYKTISLTCLKLFTKDNIRYFNPSCNFSYGSEDEWWIEAEQLPTYLPKTSPSTHASGASSIIDQALNQANQSLRALSLKIHGKGHDKTQSCHPSDSNNDQEIRRLRSTRS